jgi:diacylglycerol kinase family enzyme
MGAGFEGHLIRAADRELKKVLGKSAYALAAARNLVVDHHAFEIEVDGVRHEVKAASVMVANFGTQVGTWIFPPESAAQDGLLDVAILRAQNLEQLVTLIMGSFGAPVGPKGGLTLLRGREIRVRCEHAVPVQLDGDDQGDLEGFEARIQPAGLRVLVPPKPRPLAWPPRIEWP